MIHLIILLLTFPLSENTSTVSFTEFLNNLVNTYVRDPQPDQRTVIVSISAFAIIVTVLIILSVCLKSKNTPIPTHYPLPDDSQSYASIQSQPPPNYPLPPQYYPQYSFHYPQYQLPPPILIPDTSRQTPRHYPSLP